MAEPARLKSTTATVSLASGFAHNSRPTGHVAIRPPAYLLAHAGNKRIKKRCLHNSEFFRTQWDGHRIRTHARCCNIGLQPACLDC